MLFIYNTLTNSKELFRTTKPNLVNIYICGVTTYDLCHLGHGRTFVAFDIIIRYLRLCGYKVNYIRNITDIDDKVISKAFKTGVQSKNLSKSMITEMYKDFKIVNALQPNHEPCATKTIKHIIDYAFMLIKKKYAYLNTNGEVIYSVKTTNSYGLLSRQPVKYLNVNKLKNLNNKRSYNDFVLWKKPKPGEPSWVSPWGFGRPGWHIECSAISHRYLGANFEIHGGGLDLVFPHHENEIAQSTSAFDGSCVRIWMHTGILVLNNEKMSKALNNSIKLREVLKYYDAETLRVLFIASHYRNPLDFSIKKIKESFISLKRLYTALRGTNFRIKAELKELKEDMLSRFFNAMNDDFNTPKAFSILYSIAKRINYFKHRNFILANNLAAKLRGLGNILGLLRPESIEHVFEEHVQEKILNKAKVKIIEIEKLIKKRKLARCNKQWLLADNIRNKLYDRNIALEDEKEKTIWRFKIG